MNPASIIDDERLRSQIEFIVEIDKMKKILRRSLVTDGSKRENDAEHSWHLALMAILLKEYAEPGIDLLRVVGMVLVHDLVEIHAGDSFLYDPEAAKSKVERETKAAEKLFPILQADQCELIRGLWDEFEAASTSEAKYARALDRLQPILLNYTSGGQTWLENGVKLETAMEINLPIIARASARLADFTEDLLKNACKLGFLG